MKRLTLIISMLIALIGFNANAAMYIVGSDPFGNWNPGNGVEMTDNGDGTYSYTVAINGTVYFVFGDGLNGDWNIFNANHRYGPATGDTGISAGNWVSTQKAGDHGAYIFTGSGDDYVFTFNETDKMFKVEGYVEPFNPLTGKLFILGQVNGNNWNPSTGIDMTTADESIFTLTDVEISDSGDGYGYFSFTTKLGENADDWGFLPYRRGALADGTLVENDTETALGAWGTANAFKALPGTYDFTVSINDQNAYVKIIKKADPQPVVDDVYIMGEVNGNGWAANVGVKMTLNEGVYTANITTAAENDGKSYFSFTKMLAEGNEEADWNAIAPYRFGAASDGDFLMTEELLGAPCDLATNGSSNAIAIPAGEWTVTVDLVSNKFTIDGTWPVDTVIPEPEADVYIMGEVNGNGWAANVGVKMTLNEGVYTANITTTGENNGKSYFSFTKMLAEGNEEADWNAIAPYRFGAVSGGDFLMTEELLGAPCDLATNGSSNAIAIPAGEWTVTVDLVSNKFTIDGTWPVDTVIPEPEADVYIMGEVNGNGWAANVGVKMTLNEGVYTANITTAGENDGKSYFSFTKMLAEGNEEADWNAIAPYRFGAASEGDFWMAEELLGVQCDLATDGSYNAIAIPAGEWTVTVDLVSNKFTIDGTWPVDTVIPEPEADVYIMGEVNGNGWAANVGVKMTLNEGVYTANITTAGENDGKSYFSFTKMLAEGNEEADWNAIAPYRFGAASEGDFWMAEELLGVQCDLATDGSYNAIAIPAGEWTVTVDLVSNKFTIDGTWPAIEPEHYDGDVYILGDVNDNGGWFTNKGVKMTRDAENNVYTATITTTGEAYFNPETNTGYSYFSFTKQLAEGADDWNAIAPYRFGAVSEGDFWVTDETLGVDINLANNGSTFQIPAGEWNFTLSVDNMTLVINKVEFPRGDVDKSGDVKIADVTALINYLLSGDASLVDLQAADCDKSGDVKIGDVTVLINYLLSGVWPE